jgi:hypothetical protein
VFSVRQATKYLVAWRLQSARGGKIGGKISVSKGKKWFYTPNSIKIIQKMDARW